MIVEYRVGADMIGMRKQGSKNFTYIEKPAKFDDDFWKGVLIGASVSGVEIDELVEVSWQS
jgi:hypothetical protein